MSDEKTTAGPRVYYRIREWELRYENNRSREIQTLEWVKVPIVIGTDEYKELVMGHENGPAHLGIFYAAVQIAARCRPRGTLLRFDGTPHTIESLARAADVAAPLCGEAVTRLTTIGYLESKSFTRHAFTDGRQVTTAPQKHADKVPTVPQNGAASRTRADRTGGDLKPTPPLPPSAEGGTRRAGRQERTRAETIEAIRRSSGEGKQA